MFDMITNGVPVTVAAVTRVGDPPAHARRRAEAVADGGDRAVACARADDEPVVRAGPARPAAGARPGTTRGRAAGPGAVSAIAPSMRTDGLAAVEHGDRRAAIPRGANAAPTSAEPRGQPRRSRLPRDEVVDRVRALARRSSSSRPSADQASAGHEAGPKRPEHLRGVRVLDRDRAVAAPPRRRVRGRSAATPGRPAAMSRPASDVVEAVAVDDPQRAAGAVGDVHAVGRPAREADRRRGGAAASARRRRRARSRRACCPADTPTNRPFGDQVASRHGPSAAALAAALDDVERVALGDEQASAGGELERRCGWRAGVAVGSSTHGAPDALERPGPGRAAAATSAPAAAAATASHSMRRRGARRRGAASVCAASTVRRARSRAATSSGTSASRSARSSSSRVIGPSSSATASASSARRSRELTVPRGRSSIVAISPGV